MEVFNPAFVRANHRTRHKKENEAQLSHSGPTQFKLVNVSSDNSNFPLKCPVITTKILTQHLTNHHYSTV